MKEFASYNTKFEKIDHAGCGSMLLWLRWNVVMVIVLMSQISFCQIFSHFS